MIIWFLSFCVCVEAVQSYGATVIELNEGAERVRTVRINRIEKPGF